MDEWNKEELDDYRPEDEYASIEDAGFSPKEPPKNQFPPFLETDAGNDGIPAYVPHQYAPVTEPAPAQPTQPPMQPPVQPPVQPIQQQPMPPMPQQPIPPVQQPVQQPYYPYPPQQPAQPYYAYPRQPYPPQPGAYRAPGYQQPPQPVYPPYDPFPKKEKKKMSGGTIAFIVILAFVLVASLIGFGSYIVYNALHADRGLPDSNYSQRKDAPAEDKTPDATEEIDMYADGTFEQEITLVADNGETQQRDTDNKDNIYIPEKTPDSIDLRSLPKDKDSADYTTQSAYDSVCDSVVSVLCYKDKITEDNSTLVSQGTGTIISKDGYIITNAHVICNSRSYISKIILNNEKEYQAKVVGYDTWTDLAVLKIDAKNLSAVTFGDSSLIEIGQDVIAVGNPGGTTFKNSLTKGIVSAVGRELTINKNVEYIQSDAVINPGNSGGPLCNIYGQVIGINSVKISSEVYEGMTFSIPSKTVKEIVDDLMCYGYVKGRVRIGFSGYELSSEDVYFYGLPQGVEIDEIDEKGSLAGTNIRQGDILTAIDGVAVTSFQDIFDVLSNHKVGDKVTITLYRPQSYGQ